MASKRQTEIFRGYFLPANQQCHDNEDEGSDATDEEDWDDLDDINAMSSGGFDQRSKALKRQKCLYFLPLSPTPHSVSQTAKQGPCQILF